MRLVCYVLLAGLITAVAPGCVRTFTERDAFAPRPVAFWPEGVRIEPVTFPAERDVTLRGWLVTPLDASDPPLVLYFCGREMTVMAAGRFLTRLARETQARVLCMDYRGYGFSEGEPTFDAVQHDVLKTYDELLPRVNPSGRAVFAFGYSLGTTVATYLASERPLAGVVLQGAITSVDDFAEHLTATIGLSLMRFEPTGAIGQREQPISRIRRVQAPLLVIQGDRDRVTPPRFGRAMFEASPAAEKALIEIPGGEHEGLWSRPDAPWDALRAFIGRHAT